MGAVVINLFGGPGTGKSTGAAYIFALLKMRGVNAELVTEFAKDATWEKNFTALSNQPYVFGKQVYRISRCIDKVDVVVTDSPILLSVIYNKDKRSANTFRNYVCDVFNGFTNFNYYLTRVKKYDPNGRNQTEEEADAISKQIKEFLDNNNIKHVNLFGNEEGYREIANNILISMGKEPYTQGIE